MPDVAQPQVSKPPHQVELEKKMALLAKARVVRETLLKRNHDLAGTNPAKAYMWVNHREERQMYFKALGWEICMDPEVKSPFKQADGTHRRADVLLYEIDKDFYEALAADVQLRGIEGIEGAQSSFIGELERNRVPVHKPNVK